MSAPVSDRRVNASGCRGTRDLEIDLMTASTTRWWMARPGSQPEGPLDADQVLARIRAGAGVPDWLVCRVGATAWSDPTTDSELAPLLSALVPPPMPAAPLPPPVPAASASAPTVAGAVSPHQGLIIFIHLSQLAGYLIPGLGWILPLVLWLTNRDKPDVDRHGKEVVNFMIVVVPCICISALMMFVLIGFLMLPLVLIGQLVCVILAIVKVSNNEFFRYPIPFRAIS